MGSSASFIWVICTVSYCLAKNGDLNLKARDHFGSPLDGEAESYHLPLKGCSKDDEPSLTGLTKHLEQLQVRTSLPRLTLLPRGWCCHQERSRYPSTSSSIVGHWPLATHSPGNGCGRSDYPYHTAVKSCFGASFGQVAPPGCNRCSSPCT